VAYMLPQMTHCYAGNKIEQDMQNDSVRPFLDLCQYQILEVEQGEPHSRSHWDIPRQASPILSIASFLSLMMLYQIARDDAGFLQSLEGEQMLENFGLQISP
jgi:hypothetical protein